MKKEKVLPDPPVETTEPSHQMEFKASQSKGTSQQSDEGRIQGFVRVSYRYFYF